MDEIFFRLLALLFGPIVICYKCLNIESSVSSVTITVTNAVNCEVTKRTGPVVQIQVHGTFGPRCLRQSTCCFAEYLDRPCPMSYPVNGPFNIPDTCPVDTSHQEYGPGQVRLLNEQIE